MMQNFAATLVFILAAAVSANAQTAPATDTGDYDMIDVKAGVGSGFLDGSFDTLSEGVKIVLYSSKDSTKRLPISANEIKFDWPAGEKPRGMVLTGKVVVDHPQVNVKSEKADWDMVKGILTFTGDPIVRSPNGQEMSSQRVVINMIDNTFKAHDIVIPEWQLGGAGLNGSGAAADPSLLREQDILDWPGLLTQVRTEAAAGPSPGKQVVTLLDQSAQKTMTSVPVETLVENKAGVLKQINKVLANPKFYDAAAWSGKTIDKPTQDLLDRKDLAGQDLTRANRGLLEAAYPGMVAPAKTPAQ